MWVPDVGDPFDVAAFPARVVAPEKNAYTRFEQALDAYRLPSRDLARRAWAGRNLVVPTSDPEVSAWLDDNQRALATFLEACDMSDAEPLRVVTPQPVSGRRQVPRRGTVDELFLLTLHEGTRREARGEMAEAWACYRAILRGAQLLARHATLGGRHGAQSMRSLALNRLSRWANDLRTSRTELRIALNDVYALEAVVPDDAYTLKSIYLDVMARLRQPDRNQEAASLALLANPRETIAWRLWHATIYPLRRLRAGEPERSRRAFKLLTAQWLAYFETPPDRRPEPALRVVLSSRALGGSARVDVFGPWPEASAAARALSPESLARVFTSMVDARLAGGREWVDFQSIRQFEQAMHSAILIEVAGAVYRRDHGGMPPTDTNVLVGRYLRANPEVNDLELTDQDLPIVRDEL
jgi:hypothetical protein